MKKRALLLDFHDSFSYNLLGLLEELEFDVLLSDYTNLKNLELLSFDLLILGPGPGHIQDYEEVFEPISRVKGILPILGICLGHQILGHLSGMDCYELDEPLHGRSYFLENASENLSVPNLYAQFYNSWSLDDRGKNSGNVQVIEDLGMVVAIYGELFAGLQFHPESVGTSCPKLTLGNTLNLMYDGGYDRANGWSIRPTNHQIPSRKES